VELGTIDFETAGLFVIENMCKYIQSPVLGSAKKKPEICYVGISLDQVE
jgi:hypothetical protein